MSTIGDSWLGFDLSNFPPLEDQVPDALFETPTSIQKTETVFQKKRKLVESAASLKRSKPLIVTEKDDRQKALEQYHALLKAYPFPTPISQTFTNRYYTAITNKFPNQFNTFMGMQSAYRRYERKYKKPCPNDTVLDPEIITAFKQFETPKQTKIKAVGIIKACLAYQPDFGLQNYIDISCLLLEIPGSSEQDEIASFYHSNKDKYPAIVWAEEELQEKITPLMAGMFSEVFIKEVVGQYAALKGDPLAISILSKAYKKEFEGKLKSPYWKILSWIQNHPLPEPPPPLKNKVQEVTKTIRRKAGKQSSLTEPEIAQVVGHFKTFIQYSAHSTINTGKLLELTKKVCGVSTSPWNIKHIYDKNKDAYPAITLSKEIQAELEKLKNEARITTDLALKKEQAMEQYAALLAYTHALPSRNHTKYFDAINSVLPDAFSNIDALRLAYRRNSKKAPLDPDIKKAFDASIA